MKRIVVHIGYPKTATTTLQEAVFMKLHQEKKINYLGKTNFIRYSKEKRFFFSNSLVNSIVFDKPFHEKANISETKLNILSNEDLCLIPYFKEIQTQKKVVDPFLYPRKLKTYFENFADEIIIFVTLRNQTELIYSNYVEGYYLFKNDEKRNSFNKFLLKEMDNLEDIYSGFRFSDILTEYSNIFGRKNIHILLYEDLKYNQHFFCKELSRIINVQSNILESLLAMNNLRNKRKLKEGYYAEFVEARKITNILKKFPNNRVIDILLSTYKNTWDNEISFFKILSKLLYKRNYVFIPKFTEEHRQIILNEFREGNIRLSKNFGVSIDKLKKYRYI
ncbi:hypothetical protein HWHPT5561_09770 [Petrotoga sp. HWH.PT.55.6.1]|uniref:sulfotransferase domain-containing protein n=1 Tax=unclassified Petrotoga TaxID=2620614 RepID=UPI000CA04DB1|nr:MULTISPECIES: sulfotransferase domain-containing protein [unclassified Petrotoga]PNR91988.1 hypothetical protein X926_07340 [Petrotoga sp. HWHPT.55.6.3]RPD35029.1 hypothetical protein HWHPT5561_09770 [Petrotoga sp. HWH.PT.55.6.1]